MSEAIPSPASPRLVSLDAYRGLVMFLMAAELLALPALADNLYPWPSGAHWPQFWIWAWNWPDCPPGWPTSWIWHMLSFNSEHVQWGGLSLHDLIQPSFSFMVGVALPFSIASRVARGQSDFTMFVHALWRALLLVLLGVFLRSVGKPMTYWTFEDTLSQIGFGYPLLFMLGFVSNRTRGVALGLILVGYWLFFVLYTPPPDYSAATANVPKDWPFDATGFTAHWNINRNAAWGFDRWFLNLFPRKEEFMGNRGGYCTLSFIPTLATMILGLIAGQWMRDGHVLGEPKPRGILARLLIAGAVALAMGCLLDVAGICPSVKKIWTPAWTLVSGGWCFLIMALFYLLVDMTGWRKLAFPLAIIGMNSIAMYVMAHLFKGFIRDSLHTHVGSGQFADWAKQINPDPKIAAALEQTLLGAAILFVLWLILLWMYRRKIFLRI